MPPPKEIMLATILNAYAEIGNKSLHSKIERGVHVPEWTRH
jgi:hypothetical protein